MWHMWIGSHNVYHVDFTQPKNKRQNMLEGPNMPKENKQKPAEIKVHKTTKDYIEDSDVTYRNDLLIFGEHFG